MGFFLANHYSSFRDTLLQNQTARIAQSNKDTTLFVRLRDFESGKKCILPSAINLCDEISFNNNVKAFTRAISDFNEPVGFGF